MTSGSDSGAVLGGMTGTKDDALSSAAAADSLPAEGTARAETEADAAGLGVSARAFIVFAGGPRRSPHRARRRPILAR